MAEFTISCETQAILQSVIAAEDCEAVGQQARQAEDIAGHMKCRDLPRAALNRIVAARNPAQQKRQSKP
jgi:hypothetical protein